jgi:excisionase family DNA binding protein
MSQEKIYTTKEVADMLRVTTRYVTKVCKRGDIPGAYKVGLGRTSHWRIPQDGLDAYLKTIGKLQD